MLRATTACTFSTSQLPKVVRTPQFLTQFTSKCASRHNGVQLFISHLPRCLRTRRFSEPTFQPSGATKPRKNIVFRDFPTFSRTCIFFLLIFSLLTLLPADCFFISPYCRKFDFQTSFDDDDVSQVKLRVGPSSNQPSSRQVASRTRHPGQIWRADGEKQHLAACL